MYGEKPNFVPCDKCPNPAACKRMGQCMLATRKNVRENPKPVRPVRG